MKMEVLNDVGNAVTIGMCLKYYSEGFECAWNDGNDLTIVEQKKAYQDGNPSRHLTNISNKSISEKSSADKTNYSAVCLSCGRKLRSEVSRARGYGSSCYRKLKKIEKQTEIEEVEVIEELEGQIHVDELRKVN